MKRRNYIVFLLMLIGVYARSQDTDFTLSKTIRGDIVDFSVDNLGNIYLLSSDNQLKKIGPKGDSLAVYNDVRRYGNIYSMDVTNPLKILLFYKEFGTIVMVDRFLSVVNTIDLRSLNIFQVKAVGLAYDNNVWIYDDLEAKLKRIRDDGSLVSATTDIRQFVDVVPDPVFIADQSGLVYLYDTAKGVYIFDHYGAFQKQLQFVAWKDFNVIDKSLLGRDENYFLRYQSGNPQVQQQPIPPAYLPSNKIIIMPNAVYVLKQGRLEIYAKTP
ncbi:MAG: hypothetical protein JST75_08175 [Bacteroidetes bacterium]|nr:hypothetical protein [Bacteroidota bacterium]